MIEPKPLLEIQELHVWFSSRRRLLARSTRFTRAVNGASLSIFVGETVALVGESGSGKSSIGRAIVGLSPIRSGEIRLDGIDIRTALQSRSMAFRRRVQMVFQDPYASLSPRLRIGEILEEPLRIHGRLQGTGDKQVGRLLDMVGLSRELASRRARELSGGQCQRVAIARALTVGPELIVCDEPTSALDVSIQAQILKLLADLQNRLRLSYLFISHDLAVVRRLAHRVAVMYSGKIVELAPTGSLYQEPRHPYTVALLSAAPVPDPKVERRKPRIPVEEEDMGGPIGGCSFRPRCWLWRELGYPAICGEQEPSLIDLSTGRQSACHFPERVVMPSRTNS